MDWAISIRGLSKPAVLAALYNHSRPLGMGHLQHDPRDMTIAEATALLAKGPYLDYVRGRVMKVRLAGDLLDPRLYDRDNGAGAARRAIDSIR